MPHYNQKEMSDNLFEEPIEIADTELRKRFVVAIGAIPSDHLKELRGLLSMPKTQLEAYLSTFTMISLDQDAFERIRDFIQSLIQENREALEKLGFLVSCVAFTGIQVMECRILSGMLFLVCFNCELMINYAKTTS